MANSERERTSCVLFRVCDSSLAPLWMWWHCSHIPLAAHGIVGTNQPNQATTSAHHYKTTATLSTFSYLLPSTNYNQFKPGFLTHPRDIAFSTYIMAYWSRFGGRYVCGCQFLDLENKMWKYLPQVKLDAHTTILSTASRTVLKQTFVNTSKVKPIGEVR